MAKVQMMRGVVPWTSQGLLIGAGHPGPRRASWTSQGIVPWTHLHLGTLGTTEAQGQCQHCKQESSESAQRGFPTEGEIRIPTQGTFGPKGKTRMVFGQSGQRSPNSGS